MSLRDFIGIVNAIYFEIFFSGNYKNCKSGWKLSIVSVAL
jgi:hypothetical protein